LRCSLGSMRGRFVRQFKELVATVGFLGPEGTFTHEALSSVADLSHATFLSLPSITEVVQAVHEHRVDLGFVPMENSIEGSVLETLDQLVFYTDVLIAFEKVTEVHLDLLVPEGTRIGDIDTIYSYPHAYAQCRAWLARHVPGHEVVATNSTGEAARLVAQERRRGAAAVATSAAGKRYGLVSVAEHIEDYQDNKTRFVALAPDWFPAPTGHDKTTIVCFQREDRPGSLHAILGEFSARAINLTKLESRPTKQALGQYCFVIDLEGHVADPVVADALKTLKVELADVKFLGSYPSGQDGAERRRTEFSEAWGAAESWIASLISKMR
jgi:prephenate dehydratase